MHFFWWELDETYDMVEARIRASIASGEASENDGFVTSTWRRPEGYGPTIDLGCGTARLPGGARYAPLTIRAQLRRRSVGKPR
jgi:hypothetical protein